MTAFACEYGKSDTVVARAAVLSAHDASHADLVASPALSERYGMAVGAVEPFRMLGVRKVHPRHVTGFAHHNVVESPPHDTLAPKARAWIDQAL